MTTTTQHTELDGPSARVMRIQGPIWNALCDRYFRLEIDGWERIPTEPSLLVGVHSGGSLTMDAWTLVLAWYRHFGEDRILHGTAHDVLMAAPGLSHYFRANGVIPASRKGVTAALAAGHDVVVWPGGEQDAMRNWRKRDKAVLAGRKGFVRQAIRSGVPIVPIATVGGHDTVFVLSEGRWLANGLERVIGLKSKLRGATVPIVAGFPFGITPEITPMHIPLPAKIRTEFLDPVPVDGDPARADDREYVEAIYREVEEAIQGGMDRLAERRRFPIFA
jgi:1-acyl-sn-glycerol-3-phosphate acyltransferase